MILPTKSLNQICKELVSLYEKYEDMNTQEWEDFRLLCDAYFERTHIPVSFGHMEILREVYS